MDTTRIIIVDDHAIFRDGLKSVISQIEGFLVIDEACSGIELLKLLDTKTPDVILMDISMPEMDGIEAAEKALKKMPNVKILTLSSYSDHIYYYKAIQAGVHGFVQKKSGKEELEKAIRAINNNENYFPQEILRTLIFKIGKSGTASLNNSNLSISKRESEVLQLICKGFTNIEIADKLNLSPKTIDNHRTNLLAKTGTKNSAHLVMFAIKNHLIQV